MKKIYSVNTVLKGGDKVYSKKVVIERQDFTVIMFPLPKGNDSPLLYMHQETRVIMPPSLMESIIKQDYDEGFLKAILLGSYTDFIDAVVPGDPIKQSCIIAGIADKVTGSGFYEPGYYALDEIRAIVFSLVRGDILEDLFNFDVIETVSGVDLYMNNPIGVWEQQGDTLHKPAWLLDEKGDKVPDEIGLNIKELPDGWSYKLKTNDEIVKISYDMLPDSTKVLLKSNIYYSLLKCSVSLSERSSEKIDMRFLKFGNASFGSDAKRFHIERVDVSCKTVMEAITFRNEGIDSLPYKIS
jgi:hypothetical protein